MNTCTSILANPHKIKSFLIHTSMLYMCLQSDKPFLIALYIKSQHLSLMSIPVVGARVEQSKVSENVATIGLSGVPGVVTVSVPLGNDDEIVIAEIFPFLEPGVGITGE